MLLLVCVLDKDSVCFILFTVDGNIEQNNVTNLYKGNRIKLTGLHLAQDSNQL